MGSQSSPSAAHCHRAHPLGNDVLELVFNRLGSPSRRVARLVCKNWRDVATRCAEAASLSAALGTAAGDAAFSRLLSAFPRVQRLSLHVNGLDEPNAGRSVRQLLAQLPLLSALRVTQDTAACAFERVPLLALAAATSLTSLDLQCLVELDTLAPFVDAMPQLRRLKLQHSKRGCHWHLRLVDAHLAALQRLPNLADLEFGLLPALQPQAFAHVARLTQLTRLVMEERLEFLPLPSRATPTAASLAQLTNLVHLRVYQSLLPLDAWRVVLPSLPRLATLRFIYHSMNDELAMLLGGLSSLTLLQLQDNYSYVSESDSVAISAAGQLSLSRVPVLHMLLPVKCFNLSRAAPLLQLPNTRRLLLADVWHFSPVVHWDALSNLTHVALRASNVIGGATGLHLVTRDGTLGPLAALRGLRHFELQLKGMRWDVHALSDAVALRLQESWTQLRTLIFTVDELHIKQAGDARVPAAVLKAAKLTCRGLHTLLRLPSLERAELRLPLSLRRVSTPRSSSSSHTAAALRCLRLHLLTGAPSLPPQLQGHGIVHDNRPADNRVQVLSRQALHVLRAALPPSLAVLELTNPWVGASSLPCLAQALPCLERLTVRCAPDVTCASVVSAVSHLPALLQLGVCVHYQAPAGFSVDVLKAAFGAATGAGARPSLAVTPFRLSRTSAGEFGEDDIGEDLGTD